MSNHYVDLNMTKLETLGKKAAYCRHMIASDIPAWEKKEYNTVLVDIEAEIVQTQTCIEAMLNDPWFN